MTTTQQFTRLKTKYTQNHGVTQTIIAPRRWVRSIDHGGNAAGAMAVDSFGRPAC